MKSSLPPQLPAKGKVPKAKPLTHSRIERIPNKAARVITKDSTFFDSFNCRAIYIKEGSLPAAFLPTQTRQQARQIVRFARLSEGEQRFALAKEIASVQMGLPSLSPAGFRGMKTPRIVECCNCADALLQLTGLLAKVAK